MFGVTVSFVVTAVMVYFLLKKYQSQVVLLLAGLALLYMAIIMGAPASAILGKAKSTGFIWFDPVLFFTNTLSSRVAGLGLLIMAASGYAKYMDMIGASRLLANQLVRPLSLLRAPYVMLGCAYLVGQFLNIFIPSASGLAMLLMVTIYPALVRLGVSRLSAAAVVATSGALDLGPGSGNATLAARNAGMDITEYFINYQLVAGVFVALSIALSHFVVQYYMDKKDAQKGLTDTEESVESTEEEAHPPYFYIILPALPLIMLLTFSSFAISSVKLNVPTAMFLSGLIAIGCECFRFRHDIIGVFKKFMSFYDTMGKQFARVITLIVAGETFAQGLMATGTVDTIITAAQSTSLGGEGFIILMTVLIAIASVVMGSGNAPFFAFAALAPNISAAMGISAVSMLLPMQLVAGIARCMSPITAVVVATAGLANLSPFALVRRTVIPMLVGSIVTLIAGVLMA